MLLSKAIRTPPSSSCRWSTTSCVSWLPRGWRKKGRGKHCKRRRWFTRRTLRLVDTDKAQPWNSRGHFFTAAAEATRRILVEQARRRHAAKRGGQADREELHEAALAAPEPDQDVLAVIDALDKLATSDPLAAQLVRLRFFAGLNMAEAAAALNMSVRSDHGIWAYARSWLHRALRPD